MENEDLLAVLPRNWSSFFIGHIISQVHRVSKCAYPFAERATVPRRRRYFGKCSLRYCIRHNSQFLATVIRPV